MQISEVAETISGWRWYQLSMHARHVHLEAVLCMGEKLIGVCMCLVVCFVRLPLHIASCELYLSITVGSSH